MKITLNRLFCYLLGGLWSVFILWNILEPQKVYSQNENRKLASSPEFKYQALLDGSYFKEWDNYINDQFLLRDQWIGIQTGLEILLQKSEINQVYLGKNGYLIEKHESQNVDEQQEQKNIDRLIAFINRYSALLGNDRVQAMLVPTASEILTDELPLFASGYNQKVLLDGIKDALGDNFIDLREMMTEHQKEYIYYKTDHHWTALGAYYGYQQWAKHMGLEGKDKKDFEIVEVSDDFYGTVFSKVQIKVEPDHINLYYYQEDMGYQVEYDRMNTSDELYEYSHLEGKDQYSVYLDGNHGLVEIQTNLGNGRKLLVIKDSFAHSIVPFVVNHYETTAMMDFRYYHGDVGQYIEENDITDILVLYHTMGFVKDIYSGQFVK